MRKLLLALLLCALPAGAQTIINAAGCSAAQIYAALSSISANNTTVKVPSGTCSWSAPMTTFSTSFSFNLQGNGVIATSDSHGNPATYTDNTLIKDAQSGTSGNPPIIVVNLTGGSGQTFTMSGLSVTGNSTGHPVYSGAISISGPAGTQARVFKNHLGDPSVGMADLYISMYEPMTGVVDHNLFDVPVGQLYNGVRIYNSGGTGFGDEPWAAAPSFGTANNIFIENNTWNQGFLNDCELGGTYVARYNTINVTATNQNIGIQSHATGSQGSIGHGRGRGCRDWEAYNNWVVSVANGVQYSLGFQTSGSGLWFNNTIPAGTAYFDLALIDDRGNGIYPQDASPSGWGYCGSTYQPPGGTPVNSGSVWDQNTTTAGGYACLDQIGRGKGDLLSGDFPGNSGSGVINTTTGTAHWPNQASEPVYVWAENYTPGNPTVVTNSTNGNIQANRDYYAPASGVQTSATTPFNGTSGTGWGTLARRPTTCTAGASGAPGVGYFATDSGTQGTLYACTATNTWTTYYQPYTYPHPLVSNLTSTTTGLTSSNFTPAAGANITLTATVTPSSGPTGTVTYFDGATNIGTSTLPTLTHAVTGITAGSHVYTATYGGDSTYATSTSSPITVTASSGSPGSVITTGTKFTGGVKVQ